MSWFREIFFIHWMNLKLVRILVFRVAAGLFFAGAPAIFAQTNGSTDSFADLNLFSLNAATAPDAQLPVTVLAPTNSLASHPAATARTNGNVSVPLDITTMDPLIQKLETARYLRKVRQTKDVKALLVSLLDSKVPEPIQKSALLELAALAQDQDDLPQAQQICAQFLERWPDDMQVPEVLLRQGRVFRQMGLHNLALSKFYAVMTAALTIKSDRLDYYEHLVVQAQIEIAETHYSLGKYDDAAECLSRLFKQDNPEIDKPLLLYQLVRCYSNTTNYDEAVGGAQDYLAHYPDASEEPEVRFDLAVALKQMGRDSESLQQVLTLLQKQSTHAVAQPELWAYWQQRAGNLIANQFFREGDYSRALDIYTSLAQLDPSPQWQLPVWYQIGMTYEHLLQPQKAADTYNQIINRQGELGTNLPPSLASILDMARWRAGFIEWQNNAESANRRFAVKNAALTANAAKPLSNHE